MMQRKKNLSSLLIKGLVGLLIFLIRCPAMATDDESSTLPRWFPKLLGAQATGTYQYMPTFNSHMKERKA